MKMMPAGVVGGADCEDFSSAEPVDASDKEDGFADEQFYSFRYQVNHSNQIEEEMKEEPSSSRFEDAENQIIQMPH